MDSDTISDDSIETQTFDLRDLKLEEAYHKTFKFHQVGLTKRFV